MATSAILRGRGDRERVRHVRRRRVGRKGGHHRVALFGRRVVGPHGNAVKARGEAGERGRVGQCSGVWDRRHGAPVARGRASRVDLEAGRPLRGRGR